MTVVVTISTETINRLVRQAFEEEIVPEISGRVGRSNLLHACYALHLSGLPHVMATERGLMVMKVPVEGDVSIPWGMGFRFGLEAEAAIRPRVEDGNLHIFLDQLVFDDLRIGHGCSLPPEVLRLLGPFVEGVLQEVLMGGRDELTLDGVRFAVPLSELGEPMAKMPPLTVRLEEVETNMNGVTLRFTLGDLVSHSHIVDLVLDGMDMAVAVPEEDVQDMIRATVGATPVEVEGETTINVPDHGDVIDLLSASAETLTSFGRRGLGRRAIRGNAQIKVRYKAVVGPPTIKVSEGNRITISNAPAHLMVQSFLEMEVPTEGWLQRFVSWFRRFSRKRDVVDAKNEIVAVREWVYERDVTLKKASAVLSLKEGGRLDWGIEDIDLELNPNDSLPQKVVTEIVELVGKRIISAYLPNEIPREVDLPGDMPLKILIDELALSSHPGVLHIGANIQIRGAADPETVRRDLAEAIRERLPNGLL